MIVTAKQYGERIGYSPAAITKRLQRDGNLPQTKKCVKWGNTWQIELMKSFDAENAATEFKPNHK